MFTHAGESWQVDSVLGQGAQAQVIAVSTAAQTAALKWYSPSAATKEREEHVARIISEGSPHSRLVWPRSIVSVPGLAQFGVMMELVGPAALPLHRIGPTSWTVSRGIAASLAGAVAALHLRGLIHRDLSPTNVLADPVSGTVQVIDCDNAGSPAEPSFGVVGTKTTAAPEILDGSHHADRRSELHSLAACILRVIGPHEGVWSAQLTGLVRRARSAVNNRDRRVEATVWARVLS